MELDIKKVDDIRNAAIKRVVSYARPKTISAMIEVIIACTLAFGVEIVSFGLSLEAFYDWTFYVRTIALAFCFFLIYRGVVNAMYYKTETRDSVIDAKSKYIELNHKKDLTLKDYLVEFNLQTKIECYVAMINSRINKLEKKVIKTKDSRKREKYLDEIGNDKDQYHEATGLKALITSEFIASNINHTHIDYPIVYYSDFVDDVPDAINRNKIQTNAQYDKMFNKYSFKKVWCYLLCTVMFGISITDFTNQNKAYVFASLLMTAVTITVRIAMAIAEAPKIYDNTITKSYNDRSFVLECFLEWKNNPQTIENEKMKQQAKEDMLRVEREMIRAEEEKKAKELYETKYKIAIEEYKKQYEN